MLDVISFLFLSILAVVAAVFGIGMAGEDKKKPYVVKNVGSFKAPKKKVSEGYKAVGAAVGVGAWINAFIKGNGKGLVYDVLHAETERKKALKNPYGYLYETASPGVQNFVKTAAGANALYNALLKNDSGNSFPSIYEKLTGAAEKGQKAFDSPLDYGDGLSDASSPDSKSPSNDDIEKHIHQYIESQGYTDVDVKVKKTVKRKGEYVLGKFDDNKIELARMFKTPEGWHYLALSDIEVTIDHEYEERRQNEEGIYTGEAGVEEATVKKYLKEMRVASKKDDLNAYDRASARLKSNLKYILELDDAARDEAMNRPIIKALFSEKYRDVA